VLGAALLQAKEARMQILDVMIDCIAEPRPELRPGAPRVLTEYIPLDKIGEVIGPKGKIIREITDDTGANIDVDEVGGRGVVRIYHTEGERAEMALDRIRAIANPVVPKEGERYFGTIVKTVDFGAFVSLTPGSDGLLHISKLGGNRRLEHADEAVNVGDKVWVEVAEVKSGGKFSLNLVEGPEGSGGAAVEPTAPSEPDDDAGEPEPAASAQQERPQREERPRPERTRERGDGDGDGDGQRRRRRRRT
jgi:polyribonucleotide nucleotidyltransferase